MTIHLPEDLERFVQSNVLNGRFASEQDAITEAVRLLRKVEEKNGPNAGPTTMTPEPAWRRVVRIMRAVPDSVFERIPTDSSMHLDHYIYGSPRQPTP